MTVSWAEAFALQSEGEEEGPPFPPLEPGPLPWFLRGAERRTTEMPPSDAATNQNTLTPIGAPRHG
jgi:hypothetical protein